MASYKYFFLLFGMVTIVCFPRMSAAATLAVSPSTGTYAVGETFTVQVLLNTQGVAIDGVDLRYLNYNPAVLELLDEDASRAGTQILAHTLLSTTVINTADTTQGRISFSQTVAQGSRFSNTSGQALASIRFRVWQAGSSGVSFSFTEGSTIDTNVADGDRDMLIAVTNGSFSLGGAAGPAACSRYGSGTPASASYGLAWNWFSSARELLLSAFCAQNETNITIGKVNASLPSSNAGLVYSWGKAYAYDGSSWNIQQPLAVTCNGVKTVVADATPTDTLPDFWCNGTLTGSLPTGSSFFVGYTCVYTGTKWTCGCANANCAQSFWQLQGVIRP